MTKRCALLVIAAIIFGLTGAVYAADRITIVVHGKKVSSDEVKIENGTTFVPLRVIAESLDQNVTWDSKTKTVTIEEKEKQQFVERLVIQKNWDIFVEEKPGDSDGANQALIHNLQTIYAKAYRGFFETSTGEPEMKTEEDFSFIKESLATKEGSTDTNFNYVRLIQKPYIPQTGENAPPRKDLIFFIDVTNPKDLYLAVQHPEKLKEWKVYLIEDYGNWLQKELDTYLWSTHGFVY